MKEKSLLGEPYLSFWNIEEKKVYDHIWNQLEDGMIKDININSFLYNNSLPLGQIHKSKPLFPKYLQINSGTIWNNEIYELEQDLYTPKYIENTSFRNFLKLSEKIFKELNAKKIGVHLSGGLDSGLIICLLKELNISFVPIGLKSKSFEFRTERKIQDILINYGDSGELIDIEDYPYFSGINSIPAHQIPDDDIKSYASAVALAKAFHDKGCDIVISGQGGDTLLVDSFKYKEKTHYNIDQEFKVPTQVYRVYAPMGIKLKSFYANKDIINFFYSARLGHQEDIYKKWVRNWAAKILPPELSKFHYCADFFGLSMTGLNSAKPLIKLLFEEAYEFCNAHYFSPQQTKKFIEKDLFSFDQKEYINYCGLISVASWIHSYNYNK